MDRQSEIALIRRLIDMIGRRETMTAKDLATNPVSVYTSPERLALERETLFRRMPILVGWSCEAPAPGDWFTHDHTGVPILVVRNDAGRLNAFVNVCRHRGAPVAEGSGTGRSRFVCPYHAWTYDRDGALVGVPSEQYFEGLDRSQCGLTPLPIEERDGLVWVVPTPGESIDMAAQLGGMADELASYGLGDYHLYHRQAVRRKMNWKVAMDTFQEGYHLFALHKDTVHPIFFGHTAIVETFGENARMLVPRRTILELEDRPEEEWDLVKHSLTIHLILPNLIIIPQGDHWEQWQIFPTEDPDECEVVASLYIPEPAESESARKHWDRNVKLMWVTVDEEDFTLGEVIQRNFASGAQTHITYGRNEPVLHHFHNRLNARLGSNEAGPAAPEFA
jgi:phenylpropionate dioxygenase-like ring-hydroxylating dioxygenase large terminal subunit